MPARMAESARRILLGWTSTPDDMVRPLALLASDDWNSITGQPIIVDWDGAVVAGSGPAGDSFELYRGIGYANRSTE